MHSKTQTKRTSHCGLQATNQRMQAKETHLNCLPGCSRKARGRVEVHRSQRSMCWRRDKRTKVFASSLSTLDSSMCCANNRTGIMQWDILRRKMVDHEKTSHTSKLEMLAPWNNKRRRVFWRCKGHKIRWRQFDTCLWQSVVHRCVWAMTAQEN